MAPDIGDLSSIQIELPFAMSSTGGSGFRVGTVFECPRMAALTLLGWRLKRLAAPLWYGRVIHENAFLPYTDPENPHDLPEEARAEVAEICDKEKIVEVWTDQKGEEHTEETVVEVSDSDREILPETASNQMTVWEDARYPTEDIMACEKKVVSNLIDPETGNVPAEAEGVRLTGRIDLLHTVPKITDLKTSAQSLKQFWYEQLDYHRQASTYRYLVMAGFNIRVDDLSCFQLTKHRRLETIRKHAHEVAIEKPLRFSRIFMEYFAALRALRKCARTRTWECNWHACQGKWRPCRFLPLCWADQYDDPQEFTKTLVRKEI